MQNPSVQIYLFYYRTVKLNRLDVFALNSRSTFESRSDPLLLLGALRGNDFRVWKPVPNLIVFPMTPGRNHIDNLVLDSWSRWCSRGLEKTRFPSCVCLMQSCGFPMKTTLDSNQWGWETIKMGICDIIIRGTATQATPYSSAWYWTWTGILRPLHQNL